MKPFDLEAFKAGAVALTRDGRKAWFVAHVPELDEEFRLISRVEGEGDGVYTYWDDGRMCREEKDDYDLTHMAPTTKTLWVAVSSSGNGWRRCGNAFQDQANARIQGNDLFGLGNYTLHEITIEE